MVLAAVDSFGYKLFLLLHILAVIVAFSPAFVWPFAAVRLKKAGKPAGPAIGEMAAGNTQRIYGPALIAAGLFGFAMVGMSDKAWKFSQTWVSIGMLLWFIAIGVQFGLMGPTEKKAAAGDDTADAKLSMYGGMLHVLLLLLLIDMIWKPGL
ncbi:MAG: hypothetical protein JWN46_554 [Acidimicrobiales bacterium]|nr:hypothetical protein [Acidimicrobiales bacterium]